MACSWATAAFLAVVAVLHLLDPRDPWHRFVSEYGMGHPLLLALGFCAWAASGLVIASPLWRRKTRPARAGAGCLALFAALILVAATVQIDGPSLETPTTLEGALHVTAGRLAVAALALGLLLGFGAVRDRRSAGLLLGLLIVAFAVPVLAAPRAVGLTQRVVVGVEIGAALLLAWSLDRRPGPTASPRTCAARDAPTA